MQGWPLWCSLQDKLFRLWIFLCRPNKKKTKNTNKKEHKTNIRRFIDAMSVISRHQFDNGHELDWENISILDIEQSLYKEEYLKWYR